jgi:TonB family protein
MKAFVFLGLSVLIHCSILWSLKPTQNKQNPRVEHIELKTHKKRASKKLKSQPKRKIGHKIKEPDLFKPQPHLSHKKMKGEKVGYRSRLIKHIQSQAHYPQTAQNLKHEGSVILSLTILTDGSIKNVAIKNSAPYATLNSAALHLVKNMKNFEPLPKQLHPLQRFSIPIRYHL